MGGSHKLPDSSKPNRCRKWTATRHYSYDATATEIAGRPRPTEDEWREQIVSEFTWEAQNAYVVVLYFHDRDVVVSDSGGVVDKGLHVHAVIHYTEAITESTVDARTKVSREENRAPITSKKNYTLALLYLTHSTAKARSERKYEYDVSGAIVSVRPGYNFDYRQSRFGVIPDEEKLEREKQRDAQLYYTQQIVDGLMTIEDVHQAGYIQDEFDVGFDDLVWKRHRAGYELDRVEYMSRMANYYAIPGHKRCLSMIYIQGEQSTAKTELAEALAQRFAPGKPYHSVAAHGSGKTYDFAGNYEGQDVSIINELAPDYYPEEFCNVFDPIHAGMVNSRNNDKPWFASWCINTTSMHLEEFLWQMYRPYAKERIPVSAKDAENLKDDADWQNHYESKPTVASKISEMRRRWHIWVRLSRVYESVVVDGGSPKKLVTIANVYVRTDKSNPNHCYYSQADQEILRNNIHNNRDNAPWVLYKWVLYRDEKDTLQLVETIDEAVHLYYEINGYAVTPWNTPRPDFAALRNVKMSMKNNDD